MAHILVTCYFALKGVKSIHYAANPTGYSVNCVMPQPLGRLRGHSATCRTKGEHTPCGTRTAGPSGPKPTLWQAHTEIQSEPPMSHTEGHYAWSSQCTRLTPSLHDPRQTLACGPCHLLPIVSFLPVLCAGALLPTCPPPPLDVPHAPAPQVMAGLPLCPLLGCPSTGQYRPPLGLPLGCHFPPLLVCLLLSLPLASWFPDPVWAMPAWH